MIPNQTVRHEKISIHALREEGDTGIEPALPTWKISIHALREEGDRWRRDRWCRRTYFYPRPPRGGRHMDTVPLFGVSLNFYPRPPRGGRPVFLPCLLL